MNNVTALEFLEILAENKVDFSICRVNEASSMVKFVDVSLQKKNSASLSQNIFGALIYETLNSELREIPVSLKVFANLFELWGNNMTETQRKKAMFVAGLEYEALVYHKILRTIVERRESPNFANFVAYAECKLSSILDSVPITKRYAFMNIFSRNYIELNTNSKMGVLITERVGNGAPFNFENLALPVQPLYAFENDHHGMSEIIDPVLFQLCYSLEVMQRHRIVHNDLHAGNVLLMTLPEPVTMTFNLDEKIYRITTKYIPYIFDWDRAYAASLGDNPALEGRNSPLEQNKLTKKNDLYTLLCTFYNDQLDFFREEYEHAMIKEDKDLITITPTEEQKRKLEQYTPYAKTSNGDVYKLYNSQFAEIFGDLIGSKDIIYLMLETMFLLGENQIKIFYGHVCRPTVISKNFPTPMEYIEKHFSHFITEIPADEYSDFFVYTAPMDLEQQPIFIDKVLQTQGREKIKGKPAFSPQSSGYVKKDNSFPEIIFTMFEEPGVIRTMSSDPENLELLDSYVYEIKAGIDILKKIAPLEHYLLCPLYDTMSFELALIIKGNEENKIIEECRKHFYLDFEKKDLNLIYRKQRFKLYSININKCVFIQPEEQKEELTVRSSAVSEDISVLAIHGRKKDIVKFFTNNFGNFHAKLAGFLAVKLLDIN